MKEPCSHVSQCLRAFDEHRCITSSAPPPDHFTPPGGTITVSVGRVDGNVEVIVADSGQGIEPEFLGRIFDRFSQADGSSTRRYGGLGIGLSVVRELVTLHGGTVSATSAGPNTGASFRVTIPRLQKSSTPRPGSRRLPGEQSLDTNETLDGVTILVVDDDADSRELAARILRERGATVMTVSSVDDALRAIEHSPPDVLVSDIGMPGRDGYQLIREVRASRKSLPAVALTAFVRQEDRERAFRNGYDAHVAKPFETSELLAAIRSCRRRSSEEK